MAKHIQLTVSEPCHENWDAMTPAEKGRFCNACQKQVVDFTRMSDAQVAAFFKKPPVGSVCGRFMQDQLDREIGIPKKRIPWVKYFFQFALPALLASSKVHAQGMVRVARKEQFTACGVDKTGVDKIKDTTAFPEIKKPIAPGTGLTPSETMLPEIIFGNIGLPVEARKTGKRTIRGRVIDEKGDPVPYASIVVKESGFGAEADSTGLFLINKRLTKNEKSLIISSAGFESKEVAAAIYNGKEVRTVQLTAKVLPEVVVIAYGRTQGKVAIGEAVSVIRKDTNYTEKAQELPSASPGLKVYPNPVAAGASVNIGCEKMEENYYLFRLLNLSGQIVFQKEVWIDKGAGILNMPVPVIAAGAYMLAMTNKQTGKSFTQKIIIQ
jgi:hypothetical protein